MYKPISNSGNPPKKSAICNQVEKGSVDSSQLYCCDKNKGDCSVYSSDCISKPDSSNEVVKCHNITTIGACQRNDSNAARACEWQDTLFCLSAGVLKNIDVKEYAGFNEATKLMVSRSSLEESFNSSNPSGNSVTFCDKGQGYQLCNDTNGSVAYLTCGDLFSKEYNCDWYNITGGKQNAHLVRVPVAQLCQNSIVPTVTATVTNEIVNNDLAKSLGASGFGLSALFFILIVTLFFRINHHTGNWW